MNVAQDAQTPSAASLSLNRTMLQFFCEDTCENQPALVNELIEMYLDSVVELRDQLENAIKNRDAALLRRAAHTLKSSSRMFGIEELAFRCGKIEEYARQQKCGAAAPLVTQVLEQAEQLRPLLRAELKALGMVVEQKRK